MRWLRLSLWRAANWWRRRSGEARLAEEIEEHLAMQTADNIRAGLSPEEARRQAVLKFGGVEGAREACRDTSRFVVLEGMVRSLRYSLRRLRATPWFTVTTVAILALGIGATTSIFSLVHAILLKKLDVPNPDELYRVGKKARCCDWGGYTQEREFSLISYQLYSHLRKSTEGFRELAAFSASDRLFGVRRSGSRDSARSYRGIFVSGNYFRMFHIGAQAGRLLAPTDDRAGAPPVAVISYRLWRERYALDPTVIGSSFIVNAKPFTVVGVLPDSFQGEQLRISPTGLFFPLHAEPFMWADAALENPSEHWLQLMGRILPSRNPGAVEAQLRVGLHQWLRSHWGDMDRGERDYVDRQTLYLESGSAGMTGTREQYGQWLWVLLVASGFVLLIVCANVGQLLLVRGLERRRQVSLSMALGARASQLAMEVVVESVCLALLGGIAGLAIAYVGTSVVLHYAFPQLAGASSSVPLSASPSLPVLLFSFGLSTFVGIVFGAAPGWMAARVDPIDSLRGANRSTARSRTTGRRTVVALQASLALVLVSGSGLLAVALHRLEHQDFGFGRERRTVVKFDPRLAGYRPEQLAVFYTRVRNSLEKLPQVSRVALAIYSPLDGNQWGGGVWPDDKRAGRVASDNFASWDRVTDGFFSAIANPILKGREIGAQDIDSAPRVAVVNQAFARKFFGTEDIIGKRFGREPNQSGRYEIVGVAKDARYLVTELDEPAGPMFFLPAAQHDFSPSGKLVTPGSHYLHDVVLEAKPGMQLSEGQVRRAIAAIDSNLPIMSISKLQEQADLVFSKQRLLARLLSFFGALSLVLSCLGLYGVTAYNATQRTGEIGVRMALGARRVDVIALVLRGAVTTTVAGLLIGVPLTLGAGHLLQPQLYGLSPRDPIILSTSALLLLACGVVACLLPALRASSVSPLEALRSE